MQSFNCAIETIEDQGIEDKDRKLQVLNQQIGQSFSKNNNILLATKGKSINAADQSK